MPSRKAKITNAIVEAMSANEVIWDTDITGFGVRCQRRHKVYIFKRRISGSQRQFSIGRHGDGWNSKSARQQALKYLGAIAEGKDPAKIRDENKNRPTVKDMCERFLEEYAEVHKKPTSVYTDRINIKNHILPLLAKKYVADLTISDIDGFMRDVKTGKTARAPKKEYTSSHGVKGGLYAANRSLAILSKAINLSIKWGWRTDNPASHVSKYKERKAERYLSDTELNALGQALNKQEEMGLNPYVIAAIRLLIFIGARRGEVLNLKWSDIDFERKVAFLDDSKTGAKVLYLSAPAIEVLSNIPKQQDNPFVICGSKEGAPLINIRKPWLKIKETAQEMLGNTSSITDVRIHDLRHTFASTAAMGGMSLPMIGKLLGHSQQSTTQRYAHLADDPVRKANEAIGERLNSGIVGANKTGKKGNG